MYRVCKFFHERKGSDGSLIIPETVEDAIADLAIVFHWTCADCADMNLAELMNWREKARQRSESDEK